MSDKLLSQVCDGFYVFTETSEENVFEFYRVDEQVLVGITTEPMDMYKYYIMQKMMSGKIKKVVANNIRMDYSVDGTSIRLVTYAIGEKDPVEQEYKKQEGNAIKKLVKSIFNKKHI